MRRRCSQPFTTGDCSFQAIAHCNRQCSRTTRCDCDGSHVQRWLNTPSGIVSCLGPSPSYPPHQKLCFRTNTVAHFLTYYYKYSLKFSPRPVEMAQNRLMFACRCDESGNQVVSLPICMQGPTGKYVNLLRRASMEYQRRVKACILVFCMQGWHRRQKIPS